MISKKNLTSILIGLFLLSPLINLCQELPTTKTFTPQDTVTLVEILPGVRKLEYRKIDSVTEVQILAGNVRLKQGNTIFKCDSCVINKSLNLFEAFGNVHINDADTADVYSDYLKYFTDKRIAFLTKNVKLTDGKGVLTTSNLEYDLNTKVGIYKKGGKVVNKTTVLTSEEGYYYADLKDVYFKNNVKLKDPKYELESDSLLYNTESETARFIALTFIKDSSNRTIKTRDGYYNMKTGIAEFGKRPVVQDGAIQATGEKMYSDDASGITQIIGRAILIDTAANRTVLADEIFFNNKTESFLATKKPLMIIKQENDSIFIAADTLFSAKLSDLYSIKDSVLEKDTSNLINIIDEKTKDSSSIIIPQNKSRLPGFRDPALMTDSLKRDNSLNPITKDSISSSNPIILQGPTILKDSTLITDTLKSLVGIGPKDSLSNLIPTTRPNLPGFKNVPMKNDSLHATIGIGPNSKDSINKIIPAISISTTVSKDSILKKDTLNGVNIFDPNVKDSTNRYFEAYRNVRIYSDSLQAVCDSLFYSFKDSVFRMYHDPIVWSKESQITGDTILLYTKNKKADRMEVLKNSFIASLVAVDIFNQVKSTRMDAYFVDGTIDSVRAFGNAESIYFIQDEDSAFTGINQSSSELMDIFFKQKELERVVFRNKVKGTIWPMQQKTPLEMRLPKFSWQESRRPKSRYELFE